MPTTIESSQSVQATILGFLTTPLNGALIRSLNFDWNPDQTLKSIDFLDPSGTKLFTLKFTWDINGNPSTITRIDA